MTIKDLALVVPYHYNSVLRWLNKVPSGISYGCAVELSSVTGIPWIVWVRGHIEKSAPLTSASILLAGKDGELWVPEVTWPDAAKETMTPKELLSYAPLGALAASKFSKRMEGVKERLALKS